MQPADVAAAVWAAGAGVLAPGLCVVWWLGLGAGPLERVALAVAFGRLLLAAATLAGAALHAQEWLPAWGIVSLGACALLARRRRAATSPGGRASARGEAVALALVLAASALLVFGVLGRSGLESGLGELVFYGRHPTDDTLVYAGIAAGLEQAGLPLANPYVAGLPASHHYAFFASLAGLKAVGWAQWPDVAWRVRPLLDVSTLGLTAFALTRRLGGSVAGASAAALLLLLGGGLSEPALTLAANLGLPVRRLEAWGFGTSFPLPFNTAGPALQTAFAAGLLLAGLESAAGRRRRLGGAAAGLLVASLFELKVFLWPAFALALVGVALLRPPAALAVPLRWAAGVSIAASLPSVLGKLATAQQIAGEARVAFGACVGCLPRFLVAQSFLGAPLSLDVFERFEPGHALSPRLLAASLLAAGVWGAITLGARLVALPVAWRAAHAADAGTAVTARWLGAAGVLGLGAAVLVGTPPHWFDAAQFAWAAGFGWWPFVGVALGGWLAAAPRRLAPVLLVVALALPSSLLWLARAGYGAEAVRRIGPEERALLAALRRASAPRDLVLEPSLLAAPRDPSPVPVLAQRRVYASKGGLADILARDERARRERRLASVFGGHDRGEALAAVRASGARWLLVPRDRPLRFDPAGALEPVFANGAGTLYRVRLPAVP